MIADSSGEVETNLTTIVAEVEAELNERGSCSLEIPEQGIMIADTGCRDGERAIWRKMVDFFSIGTNDLTQYTLAIDRQNRAAGCCFTTHTMQLCFRMITHGWWKMHTNAGIWAGICGELGADLTLTEQFVRMGVDELSVAPSMILKLRKVVREMKAEE